MPETIDAILAFVVAAAIAWVLVPVCRAARPADRRDRLPPRSRPARRPDPEARRASRSWSRSRSPAGSGCPGDGETRVDPARRRRDRRGRRDRRHLRPAGAAEAARTDRRGADPGSRRRPRRRPDAALRRRLRARLGRLPGDGARDRRDRQRDQLHRRRRRPRRGRLRDLGAGAGGRSRSRSSATPAGVLAAITAGGALGFLRHGFPPASSFMGDTGSNLLGYLLAAAAVQGALKTNAVVALAFPLVVLAVPILDTGFVVAKRLKYRQPIYQADRWHFHHRMANIGFSQRRTLAYLYGWTLILAGAGAGAAVRPLQRRPRPFQPRLDDGDGGLRAAGARRRASTSSTCSRSSSSATSACASCVGIRREAGRPDPGREDGRPRRRDRTRDRELSRPSIPKPGASRPSIRRPEEPPLRGSPDAAFGYSRPAASATGVRPVQSG